MDRIDRDLEYISSKLNEELSDAARDKLSDSDFAIPERRAWPIQSAKQAHVAINFMKQGKGDGSEYPRIVRAIRKRYRDNEELMQLLDDMK